MDKEAVKRSINQRLNDLETKMEYLTTTTHTVEVVEKELQKLTETIDVYTKQIEQSVNSLDFTKLNSHIEQLIYDKVKLEYAIKDKEIKELLDYITSPKYNYDVTTVLDLAKVLNNDYEDVKAKLRDENT